MAQGLMGGGQQSQGQQTAAGADALQGLLGGGSGGGGQQQAPQAQQAPQGSAIQQPDASQDDPRTRQKVNTKYPSVFG